MEKIEIDENIANALLMIRKNCIENGCTYCKFNLNGCMLKQHPGNWKIESELRYVICKGGE